MAYFDSSKNRAMWEIELAALRWEKAARRQAGAADTGRQETMVKQSQAVIRMTYQELLKEEAEASKKETSRNRTAAALEKSAGMRQERAGEKSPEEKFEKAGGRG